MKSTRRQFMQSALGAAALTACTTRRSAATSLHCTPAPEFPVPLTQGAWRSAPFPVGKHAYHVWLKVDRKGPPDQLDCDLGPPKSWDNCHTPPLLNIEWKLWDGNNLVSTWPANPIQAAAWATDETSCFLGTFEGKRNGMFSLDWKVKQDAGRLKDLHPRVQVVKHPGYWCWL